MEAIVNQSLGNVARLDTFFLLEMVAEDYFMHGRALVWQLICTCQFFADVVGVEYGVFRGLAQAIRSVGHDVCQRANVHAEVAIEHADASDGLWTVVIETQRAVSALDDDGLWQERLKNFLARDRARSRASAAVRRGERLMQVEVHDINTKVAGTCLAHERVHVGSIHVEQAALLMET